MEHNSIASHLEATALFFKKDGAFLLIIYKANILTPLTEHFPIDSLLISSLDRKV